MALAFPQFEHKAMYFPAPIKVFLIIDAPRKSPSAYRASRGANALSDIFQHPLSRLYQVIDAKQQLEGFLKLFISGSFPDI
jgi:hypothetical protein